MFESRVEFIIQKYIQPNCKSVEVYCQHNDWFVSLDFAIRECLTFIAVYMYLFSQLIISVLASSI